VFKLQDTLSLGPLDSVSNRISFLRTMFLPPVGFIDPDVEDSSYNVFARWGELRARCQVPTRVFLWISGSGADHVLLRMACHYLQGSRAALWKVVVPPTCGGWEAVAVHTPEALARFSTSAFPLPVQTVKRMAEEYLEIVTHPEPIREVDAHGTLRYRPIDWHDAMLLACCPRHWTRAARVVGEAMGRCDPRNSLPDLFFVTRMAALVESGMMESRTPLPMIFWSWYIDIRRVDVRLLPD
jgi:hypothetical protein